MPELNDATVNKPEKKETCAVLCTFRQNVKQGSVIECAVAASCQTTQIAFRRVLIKRRKVRQQSRLEVFRRTVGTSRDDFLDKILCPLVVAVRHEHMPELTENIEFARDLISSAYWGRACCQTIC